MRSYYLAVCSAFVAMAVLPSVAQAQELEVTVASRYIDTEDFNDVFSDEPVVKLDVSYDLSKHIYVSGYMYSGFSRPFKDDSSEYGFEVGSTWDVNDHIKTGVASGRYGNYQGHGFDQGDWYVKATASYDHLAVSASFLSGVSDTALIGVSYDLPVTDRLNVKSSVLFYTTDRRLNPAVEAKYRLTDRLSLNASVVAPKDSITGVRTLYEPWALPPASEAHLAHPNYGPRYLIVAGLAFL